MVSTLHHFTTPLVESRAIRKNWEIALGVRLPLALYTHTIAAKNPFKTVFVDEEGTEMRRESHLLTKTEIDESIGHSSSRTTHQRGESRNDETANASSSTGFKRVKVERKKLYVYYFGDTKVPIDEEDEAQYNHHNFNEGEQRGCMKLIQFAKKDYIKECYLIGHNSFVAVPGWEKKTSERDLKAMHVTMSLINAMLDNNVFAICRYAPDAAKHLQLMALVPHKDVERNLVYLKAFRLPFAEDMRPFNFDNVSVSCPQPSHQQANLVDELIDAMQFNAENDSLEPECVLNPFFQRQCTALKLKALNSKANIEDDSKLGELICPSGFLKRGLEPNPKLLENAKHVLSSISSDEYGFNLQEEESKVKVEHTQTRYIDRARARLSDNFDFHMETLLDEVSVMTGAEAEEADSLYAIALARLLSLRSLAIEFGRHAEFNEWLLSSKNRWPEWALYCSSNPNPPTLISSSECPGSEYSEYEATTIWSDVN
ncbi:hypothetical protein KIN20_022645 [Parelaphostrongylus tenuis]|uniref:Ku domain-containing protein n=1 Tax=Parelaphostrongylus tenuis TaxID=148309 RepID=A0AAD5QUY4_PARTN|nr:hypothetical protein KIN20_022645 [Parelaphostrongylus tenuis]